MSISIQVIEKTVADEVLATQKSHDNTGLLVWAQAGMMWRLEAPGGQR